MLKWRKRKLTMADSSLKVEYNVSSGHSYVNGSGHSYVNGSGHSYVNGSFTQEEGSNSKDQVESENLSTISTNSSKGTEKSPVETVGVLEMFRFASDTERYFAIVGLLGSILQGAAMPLMVVVFGSVTDLLVYNDLYDQYVEQYWDNITVYLGPNVTMSEVQDDPTYIYNLLIEYNQTALAKELENKVYGDLLDQMRVYSTYFAVLGVIIIFLGYIQTTFWQMSAIRQCYRIRTLLFDSILRQDISWFDVHDSGELNTRLADDVSKIETGLGEKLGSFFQFLFTFLMGYTIGFLYSWRLTLVMIAVSPLLAAAGVVIGKIGTIITTKELKAYALAGSIAEEVIGNIRTVVAFAGQEKEISRYNAKLDGAKAFGTTKGIVSSSSLGTIFLIIFASYALAFWYGSVLFEEGIDTPGDIIVVLFGVMIGSFSLGNAFPNLEEFATARGAAHAIYAIIDQVPVINSAEEAGLKPPQVFGNIKLTDIHFTYPARQHVKVLAGLDLEVSVGQTVALVGPSGCGKSTVVQLLQRFYDPQQGQITVDGHSLHSLNVKWLRQQIGVVSQEPVLFDTSIEHNIRYGRQVVTFEEIKRAAIMANAHDFIMALPKQYDTLVGERGAQLSGGQKQRIAIARALVRDPKILLLDEATSALDTQSEAIVQSALDKARQGRTTIIIAHRLSTITTADVIAGFSEGKIVEKGNHSDLMKVEGIYYSLVTNQSESGQGEIPGIKVEDDIIMKPSKALHHPVSIVSSKEENEFKNRSPTMVEDDDEERLKDVSMKRLLVMNSAEWPYILVGCVGALVSGSVQPAFAIVFGNMLGVFSITDPVEFRETVNFWCYMFLVIGVGAALGRFMQGYCFSTSGEALTRRLREMAFKAILQQDIAFFDNHKNSTGALCARLSADASAVKGATGTRLGVVMQSLFAMACGLTIGFYFSWPLTMLILCFIPLLVVSGYVRSRLMTGKGGSRAVNEEATKISTQCIENIRTVATLTKEHHFYKEYCQLLTPSKEQNAKKAHIEGLAFGVAQSVSFFTNAACFTFGAWLIENKGLLYDEMFIVIMAVVMAAVSVGQANSFAPDYGKAKLAAGQIIRLIESHTTIDSFSTEGKKPADMLGSVELTDVEFGYATRIDIPVLRGISLRASPGQRLALVGTSGCGKSTIVQLVERFYDPTHGHLKLDSNEYLTLNVQCLRHHMGIVSQEPALFDCSIRDNIAYGDNSRQVPMDHIIEAAKQANIHNFIETLPNGYDTNVGGRGTQLSGGQKQRIAIARALVRNPKVLLLDEATSALDSESEKIVQEALDKAQQGRTCIVIAHRLSTIRNADCIVVLQNGQIMEVGTHQQLMAERNFYYRLNNAQVHS